MPEREPNKEKFLIEKGKKSVKRKKQITSLEDRKPSLSNLPEQIISQLEEAELRGKGKLPDH